VCLCGHGKNGSVARLLPRLGYETIRLRKSLLSSLHSSFKRVRALVIGNMCNNSCSYDAVRYGKGRIQYIYIGARFHRRPWQQSNET
jgi:hypothetical protein